jgi:hypothetical protein
VDDQRFDSLARVIAGLGSRRAILRGLVGVATLAAWGRRGTPASAQYGNLGPGDACYDDSQCSSSLTYGTPLVCADNGFDYDGPLNCCTGEGSYCFSDEGCCSWAYCDANQRCSFASSPGPSPSFGPNAGDPCQSTADCNRAVTGAICEYVDFTGDSRCCWYEGSLCSSGAQCCGSRVCAGGVCQFGGGSNIGSCTPERYGCNSSWECCGDLLCISGMCRALAGGSGTISSNPAPGEPCQPGVDICVYASGAFTCDFVGSTGDFRCCAYGGDRCGWDGECCGDFGCFNGICRGMAGGSGTG